MPYISIYIYIDKYLNKKKELIDFKLKLFGIQFNETAEDYKNE